MAVLVCNHCGKEHDERTKFCPLTGKAIERAEQAAATIAQPTLPPDADAPGRATRLMFLPKGMKLPGQQSEPGSAMPAPENAAQANRTMLAHVLPPRPPGSETPPTPPLRPAGLPVPPPRPSSTMPAAPARPSSTMPAAPSLPPGMPGLPPALAPGRPALPGATAPMPRPAMNPGLPPYPATSPPSYAPPAPVPAVPLASAIPVAPPSPETDATMLDMRAAEMQRHVSAGLARPAFPDAPRPEAPANLDATVRISSMRPAQADDGATPKMPQPPHAGEPARPSRKDSLPSWATTPQENLGEPFPPEQSAAYASATAGAGFLRLLQRTGKFYVANVGPLLLIAALVLGPVSIITSSLVAGLGTHSPSAATFVLNFLVYLLVMGAAWPLTIGTMTLAVLDRLHGGNMDPKRHWSFTFRRIGPLVTALVPAAFITAVGYLLFVIPGLIASLFLALVPTLVLIEGRQGADALKRSATMMKEALGPVVGIQLIFVILTLVVRKLITMVVPGTGFLDLVAADLAFIALTPLPMIALSLIYLDLRRGHEGVSPETLRHDIDALGL